MKKAFFKGLDGGHRNDYYYYFSNNLGYEVVYCKRSALKYTGCLFFLMYEESPINFLLIGLIRRLFGKKTVILIFNPFYEKIYSLSFFKSGLAKFFDLIGLIHFIPIIPRCAYNRKGFSFKNHCLDPQFYDLDPLKLSVIKDEVECNEFNYIDKNKLTVTILGTLNVGKEIEKFIEFATSNKQKYNFVAAGKMDEAIKVRLKDIDVFVENNWLSESRYLELLILSDLVWCYFSAVYDQSSGTLGRVLQVGKIPILRIGSVAENICKSVGAKYVSLNKNTELCEEVIHAQGNSIIVHDSLKISVIAKNLCG